MGMEMGKEGKLSKGADVCFCARRDPFLDRACAIEKMGREAAVVEEGAGKFLHALQ